MGKAAILLVIAAGITVAYGMMSANETSHHTAKNQAQYEEKLLAREIARSGFNMAMGIVRMHGDSLQAGVMAVNGDTGYLEGESQGGVYRATARYVSGHSIEVVATGYFGGTFTDVGSYEGGAHYVMEDNSQYTVRRTPLHAMDCALLKADVVMSQTNYCSAVYMQRYVRGDDGLVELDPELVYPAGKNRTGSYPLETLIQSGTVVNFFIGVDENCASAPASGDEYDIENHVFNSGTYQRLHHALDVDLGNTMTVEESIFAMVEQHPHNNQRWRIAWEDQARWDIHNPRHGSYDDPTRSLMGLKRNGYDGNGWTSTDSQGYRTLQNFPNRPDFSDQVIDVRFEPASCLAGSDSSDPDDGSEIELPDPITQSCPCPGTGPSNRKVLIMHRPPGNPGNEQEICISGSALQSHLDNHDDFVICSAP